MTDEPEKVDLTRRRTVVRPADDEGVDPISPPARTAPARAESRTKPLNMQVDEDVWEFIDYLKYKTKKKKKEIVEEAVRNYWAHERPTTN